MPAALLGLRRPEKSQRRVVYAGRICRNLMVTVLFVLLFTVFSERVAAQGQKDPHEREYRGLASNPDLTVQGHLGIADWCLRVAKRDPRRASVYNSRGAQHVKEAEKLAHAAIEEIFRGGISLIKKSGGYDEALASQKATDQAARESVEMFADEFRSYSSLEAVRDAFESGSKAVEVALRPFVSRGALGRVREGHFLIDKKWVSVDSPATESFAGLVPLSRIRRNPGNHLHRYFATEFISSAKLYKILDLILLDGFDDRGKYLVPNFMDGRVVLSLPRKSYRWNEEFARLRKLPGASRSGESAAGEATYRFRILATMAEEEIQSTRFFPVKIEQVAVFDEQGKFLQYFGPIPERL